MADTHEIKQDLWDKMAESPFVMVGLTGGGEHSEPLTAQLDRDLVDTLYFFVGKDNRLIGGGAAMAQFVSKGHDFFACLSGNVARKRPRDDRQIMEQAGRGLVSRRQGRPQPRADPLRHRQRRTVGNRHEPVGEAQDAGRRDDQAVRSRQPRQGRDDRGVQPAPVIPGLAGIRFFFPLDRKNKSGAPDQVRGDGLGVSRAIHCSTTGAILFRHRLPLKMP